MNIALHYEVQDLYARYARAVDDARFDDWLALFDTDCACLLYPSDAAADLQPLTHLLSRSDTK